MVQRKNQDSSGRRKMRDTSIGPDNKLEGREDQVTNDPLDGADNARFSRGGWTYRGKGKGKPGGGGLPYRPDPPGIEAPDNWQ